MPNQPLYPNAKPVDGDVLILCEGDAVGYETQLLKLWADKSDLNGRFVKVIPCGTTNALYGMADAVGRTIPVIIVEDRDFRTVEEAEKECDKNLKNREGRSVAMRGWFAWKRAEIENYFVDDAVLPKVFSEWFQCSPDSVRDAIAASLSSLAVSQALEYALYRARKSWASTDANRALRVNALEWSDSGLSPLAPEKIRKKLEGRLKKWQDSLHDGTTWKDPMAGGQLLGDFNEKCDEWRDMCYYSEVWRRDWACKELLKHVRMTLTSAKGGWWSHEDAPNRPVPWAKLAGDKARDDHDRKVERQVQSALVAATLDRFVNDPDFDLNAELSHLAELIRSA